jgi:hypothetical protein
MNAAVINSAPDRHLRGGNADTLRCTAERIGEVASGIA